ncbi:hypothetical protein EYC80_006001 [Monilinia laxa]|uniref:Uncharacterized protein n=1 Tax=Monilinia laxa TaxID=61186 RepID=A0A5N6KFV0_MONLA|nr:hypothetical protein EYC80_006001 [Monilinia laxa]
MAEYTTPYAMLCYTILSCPVLSCPVLSFLNLCRMNDRNDWKGINDLPNNAEVGSASFGSLMSESGREWNSGRVVSR